MYEHIKICLFFYLYFQNVISYKIYQLDATASDKLIPKTRQLLQSQGYDDSDYPSVQQRPANRESPRLKPMGKSVLVKRVIPHGYVTGDYEYDSKLNTVYKPLARYHVQKPIEESERFLNLIKSKQKPKHRSDRDRIALAKTKETKQDLLNLIMHYLAKNKKLHISKKKNVIEDLFKITDGLSNDSLMSLREAYDPDIQHEASSEEHDHKTVMPIYPFWNYWTYQKNVVQDFCPENLILVGNMCISKLGHRKNEDLPDTRRSHHHKKRRSIRDQRKKHLYGG